MSQSAEGSLEKLMMKPLAEATCLEIQLELIRRRKFNAFSGERVAAALLKYRGLWDAVMMDRLAISNPGRLPSLGMVKLRDLAHNDWNVDTLYVLTHNQADAEKLAQLFSGPEWGGMADVHADYEEVTDALGGSTAGQSIVIIWWS